MSGKLKEVRERIKSIKSTQQITNAMKMVAAAKLRKATDGIQKMRPYSEKLGEMLSNIVSSEEGSLRIDYAVERSVEKVLIVLVTSDRGLCGGYNSNIIKIARRLIKETYRQQWEAGNIVVVPLGKKGLEAMQRIDNIRVVNDYVDIFTKLSFENAGVIAEKIMEAYAAERYDAVRLVYSKFKNAATFIYSDDSFLPIEKPQADEAVAKISIDYVYEPAKEEMINQLVPKILKTQIYRVILDANASEQGARMTAMDQATENAKDILRDLQIDYNRARQAAITTELTEIVSGAAALEGS